MNHCKHYNEQRDGHIAKLAGELVHKLKTQQTTRGHVTEAINQAKKSDREHLKSKINEYIRRGK